MQWFIERFPKVSGRARFVSVFLEGQSNIACAAEMRRGHDARLIREAEMLMFVGLSWPQF